MGYLKDHLEKLPALAAIADHGSLRKAARQLRLTQPALTRQVMILEDVLGQKLLSRTTKGVTLTNQGLLLSDYARKLIKETEDLETGLTQEKEPLVLRIGTFESLSIRLWPHILLLVREKCAHTRVGVSTGDTLELYDRVVNRVIDCAMVMLVKQHSASIEEMPLFTDAFGLFVSPKLKLPDKKVFSPGDLDGIPFATVQGSHCQTGDDVLDLLRSSGFGLKDFLPVDTFEAAANYAREGIGISVMPHIIAAPSVKKKKLLPLKTKSFPQNRFGEHTMGLVYRKDSPKREALNQLHSLLDEYFQSESF